jgi:hypothetical protein
VGNEHRDRKSNSERSAAAMSWGLSYALTLRAIGQSLEAQQTKNFDLSALETGFIVRENERRYPKGRRTIRPDGIGRVLDLSDVHYSVDDLEDAYRTFLPAWEKLPAVPTAAVQTMLNFATHPAATTAKAESFIDNTALVELDKPGFVDRLYK